MVYIKVLFSILIVLPMLALGGWLLSRYYDGFLKNSSKKETGDNRPSNQDSRRN